MRDAVPTCDWYFDVVSPYSYLQWKTRARLGGRIALRPVPVVLGAILDHWGQKGPAEIAPKRVYAYRSCHWRAQQLGLPLAFPPAHPFNPLSALRLIVALDATADAVEAVFDAVFGKGLDITDPSLIEAIGRSLGADDSLERIARPEVKLRLRANTDAAIARGVFGVPTTAVGGELFWGADSTDMLLAFLDDPGLFETPEMRRLKSLPSGIVGR
jgi:2-hydroxychromene-2-carboxylate isomerase